MSTPQSQRPVVRLGSSGGINLTGEAARDTRSTVRRLLGFLKPYWRSLAVVAVLAIFGTVMGLAGPILIGRAIDTHIAGMDLDGLLNTVVILLLVYSGDGLSSVIQGVMMVSIGQKFVAQLRTRLFNHIQLLSMAYHDQHSVGDLMSRVTNDTDAINQALSNGLIEFTTNILLLGGIMIAMFFLNWQLALGTVTILPIMLYITTQVTKRSRKAFRQVQGRLGALNGVMEENIAGLRVVKAFAREGVRD
jgi:ATP-binding cassette subfamily B protein